ncbi:uncharacterized protein LOC105693860 [Athalia rosae]|uniref:uncharacterized protein LOC105693860 n=1 Tax=Athalia rosae TaxID=37344 RepID=UPI00203337BB|nr:uncharacterized protein LOC105693860 [Athalia rosae]XP_048510655.1 uncharacterized protein LOC105693860 [Athalia rosae]
MMYTVLTGKRPSLMLPWLWLQMLKNITTDIICLAVGALLCLVLHSCGILAVEFLVVGVLSTMPSVYLWRRLRAYYNNLYYAQIDGFAEPPIPREKYRSFALARRRRASKSLDGTIPLLIAVNDRPRIGSCVTYDEFFGTSNWEEKSDKEISKSLTTLLTAESQDSDEIEEDSCLKIIEDDNLTPAQKTLRILGIARDVVEPDEARFSKTTSTDDLGDGKAESLDSFDETEMRLSLFTIVGAALEPRTVGLQVNLEGRRGKEASETEGKSDRKGVKSKKCACCEETKCADDDSDSNSDDEETGKNKNDRGITDRSNCCDRSRPENAEWKKFSDGNKEAKTGSENGKHSTRSASSCLQALVERDGIVWTNFREINFVSVIEKSLCGRTGSFKLQSQREAAEEEEISNFGVKNSQREAPDNIFKDWPKFDDDSCHGKIIPEREDGTKFTERIGLESRHFGELFSGPKSASFGADSEILALDASDVFNENSGVRSFNSTTANAEQLTRPEQDSYFESSFQRHSDMFDDSTHARGNLEAPFKSPMCRIDDRRNGWELGAKTFAGNDVDRVRDSYEIIRRSKEQFFDSRAHQGVNIGPKLSLASKKSPTKRRSASWGKKFSPSFVSVEKSEESGRTHPTKDDYGPWMTGEDHETADKSEKRSNDRRLPASSSRSSKCRETPEEREERMMRALKAYNEKTLVEYKRELEARNSQGTSFGSTLHHDVAETPSPPPRQRIVDELDPLKSTASTCGIHFKQGNRVSVPGLVAPERELIFNLENRYGKLTRSKPADSTTNAGLAGDRVDVQKIKPGDETSATRKQLSKYSKFVRGKDDPPDIADSGSCKRIEGLRRGRDLDRILAREDIRSENVEVYFLDRSRTGDTTSTGENLSLRTIKSFSGNRAADIGSAASSDIIASEGAAPQTVREIDSNPRDESAGRGKAVEKSSPKSTREVIELVDWSFRLPIPVEGGLQRTRESFNNLTRTMPRYERSPERDDMFYKNTENILRFAFANDENFEGGFFAVGSSEDFTLGVEEFLTTAASGYRGDDFVCRPESEELANGDFYGGISLPNSEKPTEKTSTITSEQVRQALEDVIACRPGIVDRFEESGEGIQSVALKFFDDFPISENFLKNESSSLAKIVPRSLTGSEFATGFGTLFIFNAAQSVAGKMRKTVEQTTSTAGENGGAETVENFTERPSTSANSNFGNDEDGWMSNAGGKNAENRRVVIDADSSRGSETSSVEKLNDSFRNSDKRLLRNFSSDSVISSLSDSLRRQNFRRNVIVSVFVHAINDGGSEMGVLETDQEPVESQSATGSHRDNRESRRVEAAEIVRSAKETDASEIKKGAFSIAADDATRYAVRMEVVPGTTSSKETSENPQPSPEPSLKYSSWEKILPKTEKKNVFKPKKANADRVSFRRVIKVVKLVEDNSLDFFSARPVPQRGRGLSSGYLMDSDSDGNLTVSRTSSPVSLDSISSQNSYENEPEIPTGIFENSSNSPAAREPPQKSRSPSTIDLQGPSGARTPEFRILGSDTLPTSGRLGHLSSVDAAGIETKLKDVMRQIFLHQSTAGPRRTSGLLTVSKTASPISISLENKIADPSIDRRQEIFDAEEEVLKIMDEMIFAVVFSPATRDSNFDGAFRTNPRKSKVSLRHAAIGTEYDLEVFKDLVESFARFHGVGGETLMRRVSGGRDAKVADSNVELSPFEESEPAEEEASRENNVQPEFASYDSFDSNYSMSKANRSADSPSPNNSISDHTFLEDFPEDGRSQVTSPTRSTLDGSESNGERKKVSSSKKTGIPRPVKGSN